MNQPCLHIRLEVHGSQNIIYLSCKQLGLLHVFLEEVPHFRLICSCGYAFLTRNIKVSISQVVGNLFNQLALNTCKLKIVVAAPGWTSGVRSNTVPRVALAPSKTDRLDVSNPA